MLHAYGKAVRVSCLAATRRGAVAFILLWIGLALGAAPRAASDAEVKAAFVFNFLRYVDWPEGVPAAGQPLIVCRAGGPSAFMNALDAMEGRQMRGREVRVRQAGADLSGCHVLVLDEGENAALQRAQGLPILTVGEGWPFLDGGGVLALAVVDGRVAFGANLEAARRSRLRMSSQLLKLARRIVEPAK